MVINSLAAEELRPVNQVARLTARPIAPGLIFFPQGPIRFPPVTLPPPEGPALDAFPTSCDTFWTGDGAEYFVPAAELATRSSGSPVPALYLDPISGLDPNSGGCTFRAVLDFARAPGLPQDQGQPLELEQLSVRLYAPLEGGELSTELTDITDAPPVTAGVVRRIVVKGPVDSDWIKLMRATPGTVLIVNAVPKYHHSPGLEQNIQRARNRGDATAGQHPTVLVTAQPEGVPMYFPAGNPNTAAIFAQVEHTSGTWVLGPAGAWRASPVTNQFYALPTEYRLAFDVEHAQPAVTVLLLEPPPATDTQPTAAYRVRIRFKLVPWFEPQQLDRLRQDIAGSTGVIYPDLVVGGYDSADFAPSTLFKDLGGTVLGQDASVMTVDGRGFELVFDCSMEFYTLMCGLLAPKAGTPTGLEGRVRFGLAAPDGGSPLVRDVPVKIRLDVPTDDFLTFEQVPLPDPATWPPNWVPPLYARVRNQAAAAASVQSALGTLLLGTADDHVADAAIRVQASPATFVVPAAGTPAPPAPAAPSAPPHFPGLLGPDPGHDRPAVRTLQNRLVKLGYLKAKDVDGRFGDFTGAMTKRFQGDQGLPQTGTVDQATWRALFPPPSPSPPVPGSGEVVLALTATEPVDVSTIGGLALAFDGARLSTDAATVLERVHQLSATTTAATTIRVRSFQLAHPENLPPAVADVYGLEVQIRRGQRQPVTTYLTREEPDKTVTLNLLIDDLVAGVDPQQPTFDWRCRNMAPSGTSQFSDWETVTGRELFATPVVPSGG
jgi:peptidoglycan hydrolase-like protein with peptidoglycan-binding domain